MNMIITLAIVFTVLGTIGAGAGYLIWLKTRKKKETYKAYVYQLSQGTRYSTNKEGQVIGKIPLRDLKPFSVDVLEKVEEDTGIVRYRLQKLGKPTPAIGNDSVEYWGEKYKLVHVLYHEGNCVLLEKGYDIGTESMIYHPIPYDRINILKDEINERKKRLEKPQKDLLEAILPYIGIILSLVMVFGISYMAVQGMIQIAQLNNEGMDKVASALSKGALTGSSIIPTNVGQTARNVNVPQAGVQNTVVTG